MDTAEGHEVAGAAPSGHGAGAHEGFPWKHIIGYALSLALTFIALALVVTDAFSTATVIVIIVALAICQVLVQLFFFMHLREREDGKGARWHAWMLAFGFFIAAAVIAGSFWIMEFKSITS